MSEAHRGGVWSRERPMPTDDDLTTRLARVGANLESARDRDVLEEAIEELERLRDQLKAEEQVLRCWNCRRPATTMRPAGGACTICAELYDAAAHGELHCRSAS